MRRALEIAGAPPYSPRPLDAPASQQLLALSARPMAFHSDKTFRLSIRVSIHSAIFIRSVISPLTAAPALLSFISAAAVR